MSAAVMLVDVGERRKVVVKLQSDGRIEFRQDGKAGVVVTSVARVFFSALRTRALNVVRDRERAAGRRLARKEAPR